MAGDAGAGLVGRSFRIVAIDGVPVLETPTADITFGVDGRVGGRATVNRFAGPYELDGDVLTMGPLVGTLMAGSPEAMEQEQRLHRALALPLTVVPGDEQDRDRAQDRDRERDHEQGHDRDARRVELRSGDGVVLVLVETEPAERM
jgi:hypothetical protein